MRKQMLRNRYRQYKGKENMKDINFSRNISILKTNSRVDSLK